MFKSRSERDADEVQFFYLRDEQNSPQVCIAYQVSASTSDVDPQDTRFKRFTIKFSISVVSDNDNPSKKIGRDIARGRLKKGKFISFDTDKSERGHIFSRILKYCEDDWSPKVRRLTRATRSGNASTDKSDSDL